MAITASGTISASDIRTEFVGGSSAIDISSFYRGANTNVKSNASNNTATNLAAGVPTSGAISFSDFYSQAKDCLLYTSPSPRDRTRSRMPSSA